MGEFPVSHVTSGALSFPTAVTEDPEHLDSWETRLISPTKGFPGAIVIANQGVECRVLKVTAVRKEVEITGPPEHDCCLKATLGHRSPAWKTLGR